MSISSDGTPGDADSDEAAISADGRYVAFRSYASNLVAGDTNGVGDVFVHDRQSGGTTRVSVDSSGVEANGASQDADVSADGRYVTFRSIASNLVPGDTNVRTDVFVHDRQTGETKRVSVDSSGTESEDHSWNPVISSDGRYVAFDSGASNLTASDGALNDVFVHDRSTGETTLVSKASDGTPSNNSATNPAISGDGRYVAFVSGADNLVAGDTNGKTDVFVHDRQTGETVRVSVDSSGTQAGDHSFAPDLSSDGMLVAFHSSASDLVSGDTNGQPDVFVRDRDSGTTVRVSVSSDGAQGDGSSNEAAVSADGRYVAFYAAASNLVTGDTNGETDVFVHDRDTRATTLASVGSDGTQGNETSNFPSIDADGSTVAYQSDADNLIADDTNTARDVFVGVLDGTNVQPAVEAGPDASGETDTPIALDGTVSDPDGDPVTTSWAVDDASCSFEDASAVDTTVTCTDPGTYVVTLTADDGVTPVVSDSAQLTVTPMVLESLKVLGGTAAVSDAVATEAADVAGAALDRLAGTDRWQTAAQAVADAFPNGADTVYLATGLNFPDALAGAAAAAQLGAPVLLTAPDQLPEPTRTELQRLNPTTIKVLGGTAAVSDAVADQAADTTGANIDRQAGTDRWATAAIAVADAFPNGADTVYLATGLNFPDALAGAAAAAQLGAPVLLTAPDQLPEPTRDQLAAF